MTTHPKAGPWPPWRQARQAFSHPGLRQLPGMLTEDITFVIRIRQARPAARPDRLSCQVVDPARSPSDGTMGPERPARQLPC